MAVGGTSVSVAVGTKVLVGVGGNSVAVAVGGTSVAVGTAVSVAVGTAVSVAVGVAVGTGVSVIVGVAVGGTGVLVSVAVGIGCRIGGVRVGVDSRVCVAVGGNVGVSVKDANVGGAVTGVELLVGTSTVEVAAGLDGDVLVGVGVSKGLVSPEAPPCALVFVGSGKVVRVAATVLSSVGVRVGVAAP